VDLQRDSATKAREALESGDRQLAFEDIAKDWLSAHDISFR
jgi:hypothetical protein